MARDIVSVIEAVIQTLPDEAKMLDLRSSLKKIQATASYRPPEDVWDLWDWLVSTLYDHLGDPSGVSWKQRISDIMADKVPLEEVDSAT